LSKDGISRGTKSIKVFWFFFSKKELLASLVLFQMQRRRTPMPHQPRTPARIDCPSAQPNSEDARIYGVVTGRPEARRIAYLTESRPASPDLLALTGEAKPTEVYRIAAPCSNGGCRHFAGNACTLVQRVVALMEPVVDGLPACGIRRTCRWFHQEGKAACLRCPQVVTERNDATELDWAIAGEPR